MRFITLEQADQAAKTDGEDQELLTTYANAAEARCEGLCNRRIYKDQTEFDTALASVPANVLAAQVTYRDAVEAAELVEDQVTREWLLTVAKFNYDRSIQEEQSVVNGMVAGDDFIAAVLLVTCHLYGNREDVVTGQGANAVALPHGARDILTRYLWPGSL